MKKFRFMISTLAVAMVTLAFASLTQAQATRTWVSGVGDDANPCSRTAPCKTFAGAISKTFIGGEISVLDPGGFGAVTITKSMTIDGTGTLASILPGATNGVLINIAVSANDPFRQVTIRGLTINGAGASGAVGTRVGLNGIRILSATTVSVEDTIIQNFSQNGITSATSAAVTLNVNNTQIKNCTEAGIRADTSGGLARVTVKNSTITGCASGINARRNSRVAVTESSLAANAIGVHVEGNGGVAVAVLVRCQIGSSSGIGVQAGGGLATTSSVARIGDNNINNNSLGATSIQANGSIETFGDNKITGNTPDGCPGCTSIAATNIN